MKVSKDRLSVDMPLITNHKWQKGKFALSGVHSTRIDTCKSCGCTRFTIRFYLNGALRTEVSHYERSGISFGAMHRPECWGAKEPK